MTHANPALRGMLWSLAAGALFSVLNATMRMLTIELDPMVTQFLRYLMGLAVMLPFVLWFSLSQQISGEGIQVQMLPRIAEYLELVTALILAFGLSFQLPVVVTLLGMAGIINSKTLASGRRYAIVGVVVLAAVVTPPDPISQLMLAAPLVLLYEISIWCVRIIELRRRDEAPDEDEEEVTA